METYSIILGIIFIGGTLLLTGMSWWILLSEEKQISKREYTSKLVAPDYYKESRIKIDPEKILYSEMVELKNNDRKLELD